MYPVAGIIAWTKKMDEEEPDKQIDELIKEYTADKIILYSWTNIEALIYSSEISWLSL